MEQGKESCGLQKSRKQCCFPGEMLNHQCSRGFATVTAVPRPTKWRRRLEELKSRFGVSTAGLKSVTNGRAGKKRCWSWANTYNINSGSGGSTMAHETPVRRTTYLPGQLGKKSGIFEFQRLKGLIQTREPMRWTAESQSHQSKVRSNRESDLSTAQVSGNV